MVKKWRQLSKQEKINIKEGLKSFPRMGYASGLSDDEIYHYTNNMTIDRDILKYPPNTWARKQSKRNNRASSLTYEGDPDDLDDKNPYKEVSESSSDEEPVKIVPKKNKKGKREYTAEQKKALVDRLRKGRERKKAQRDAKNKVLEEAAKANDLPPKKTPEPAKEEVIVNDVKEVKEAPKKEEETPVKKETKEPEYVRVSVAEYKNTMAEIDKRWNTRFDEFRSKYEKKTPAPVVKPEPVAQPIPIIQPRTLGRFSAPNW